MVVRGHCVVGLLFLLATLSQRAWADEPDKYERAITEELRAANPAAVALFEQANEARQREDHATAARLYGEVFAEVPSFIHAERRQCMELAALGKKDEGIALCRNALKVDQSAANLTGLAHALMSKSPAESLSSRDTGEASELLNRAERLEPDNDNVAFAQCKLALELRNLSYLESCSKRLERLAPRHPMTFYTSWVVAMSHEQWGEASDIIARGKAAQVPPKMLEEMQKGLDENRPWTDGLLALGAYIFAAWAGLLLALTLAGVSLSRATLRHAEGWSSSPEAAARSGKLRGVYRAVLFVCCAAYYASLPLVLLVVIGGAGGLVYVMIAAGQIPIKLVLLLILMVFATCGAVIKSLFWRPREEEPGLKVDLSREPNLRATLHEVADRIGTRPVDTVYMTPNTDIAVFERRRGERCLLLGAGVLDGMPLRSFKAILAHEYGHFSNRDTAGGGFALRVRRSVLMFIVHLAQTGQATRWNPAWWFARGFYLLFLRISQGASRLQEILADRRAAEAYGGEAFAQGLRHVVDRSVHFGPRVEAEVNRAVKSKAPLENLWVASNLSSTDIGTELEKAMNREPSPYDSHPAPRDRIRWVERTLANHEDTESAEGTAWDLFVDRKHQEREMTLLVYQNLAMAGVRLAPLPP
jgi:Zn-dependent protease with chaperone function